MSKAHPERIAVFGLGYVGCVTAACLASRGCTVIGVDTNPEKVDAVKRGQSPINEPGLADLTAAQVACGRLQATTVVSDALDASELAIIAVGTPSDPQGGVDTTTIERVIGQIVQALPVDRPYIVVIRSTLLPGFLEEQLSKMVADLPLLSLCNHPEFLRETTAISDFMHPPMIVVGAADRAIGQRVMELYDSFECPKIVTDTGTAAMVKYACNALHALKIGFANEIGALSRVLGINGLDVMRIVCLDQRLNISPAYLRPGFAFGGSCLPKDLRALNRSAQMAAVQTDLLQSILSSNRMHFERVLPIIRSYGVKQVGMLGLTFKSGTDDLRESPLVLLAETLIGQGL